MNLTDPAGYTELEMVPWFSRESEDVRWSVGYFAFGGAGAEHSTSLYYEIPAGKRLGRHSNTAEETQFFVGGRGIVVTPEASVPVKAGDFIVIGEGAVHDVHNTGPEPLRAVAFFAAPEVEHDWCEDQLETGDGEMTGTPAQA